MRPGVTPLALFVTAALVWVALPAQADESSPVGSHAQLYTCCTPGPLKEAIFAESKAMGASFIRLDVEMGGIYERDAAALEQPDWGELDQVMWLSQAYDLPVLGIIRRTPTYLSTCPESWPYAGTCAAKDARRYGELAGEIAAHASPVITHWEVINEPNGHWAFTGTPEEYAQMLSASHHEIHRRVPQAKVVLGGLMASGNWDWMTRVFATPGVVSSRSFDIANIHLRGRAARLESRLSAATTFFASYGFTGPIWVTEHGYPSAREWQDDPRYVGGEIAQARYLSDSLLRLATAGADRIFITLRDNLDQRWASEGVVRIDPAPPYHVRRKPAFDAVREFVDRWRWIPAWRASQRKHDATAAAHDGLARRESRRLAADRRAARATKRERRVHLSHRHARAGPARDCRRTVRELGLRFSMLKQHMAAHRRREGNHEAAASRHAAASYYYANLVLGPKI
jgi:hypothetical protein